MTKIEWEILGYFDQIYSFLFVPMKVGKSTFLLTEEPNSKTTYVTFSQMGFFMEK